MAAAPSIDLSATDCRWYGGGESTAVAHQLDGHSPSTSGGEVAFTFLEPCESVQHA
jgi:hypothetical protein